MKKRLEKHFYAIFMGKVNDISVISGTITGGHLADNVHSVLTQKLKTVGNFTDLSERNSCQRKHHCEGIVSNKRNFLKNAFLIFAG